ncbi:unnamed protein product [Blepharisma stoltei]|uniref:PAS domain-containing protein n=1 Tax=Blepharisma stoltei TaxID=1481888 RepID=A0AAU9J918_9CILI|nr:unnamed protein product [Blepharisma stoltei]
MLLDLYEQFFESTEINNLKLKQSSFEKQKIVIFKIFGKIFQSKYNSGYRIRSQLLVEALFNFTLALQMISLTWYPDMEISGWNRYITFWDIVSYFNLNNFCGTFEATAYCFHGVNTVLSICVGLLLLMFVFSCMSLKFPLILVQILKNLLSVWVTVLYIPTLIELSMIFKYSTFNYDKIYEFSGKHSSDLLNYGISGSILIIVYMIFLIIMAYLWELFASDVRHAFWDKNLTVRAHSSVDLKMLTFKTCMSISYVLFRNVSITIYQIMCMIASFCIFLEFIVKLPYYSKAENSIKSCKILTVSISLLAVLLGTAMDDAGVPFMLNFFLQPIIIVINCWFVNSRINSIKKSEINFTSQYDFERTARHLLCNRHLEKKIQVINYFTACYVNKALAKDKLLIVWEVNFCSFTMKDEKLARIKLTKINSVNSTLEGSIQEWRALKNIDERDSSSVDAHYIEYLEDFNKAKKFDQEICYAFIDLWSEFSEKFPKYKKIYYHSIRSSDLLTNLKEFYVKLVSKYKHPELYDLYISFLENILGEIDEAGIMNRLKGNINHQVSFSTIYDTKLTSYEEMNGIILISANEDSFGVITYVNDRAAQLLKGSNIDIAGTQLSSYIPSPYNYNHDEHLRNLYINYTSEEVLKRGPFFLQNTLGYLEECGFLIKLAAFHNNAYFLATLTKRTTNRQLALISEEGVVYNTTDLFPHFIGATTNSIRNYCISDFIPGLDISQMKLYEPLIVQQKGIKLALVHIIKELRTTTIHMLLLIHDEKEIKIWKEGQDIDQIEYFKKIQVSREEKMGQELPLKHLQHSITFRFQKFITSENNQREESKEIERHRLLNEVSKESCKNLDNVDEKSISNMQVSNISSSSSTAAQRCIESLSKNLKHFQWILLFCVILI